MRKIFRFNHMQFLRRYSLLMIFLVSVTIVSGQSATSIPINRVQFPPQRYSERLTEANVKYQVPIGQIREVKTFSDLFYTTERDSSLYCVVTFAPKVGNSVDADSVFSAFPESALQNFTSCGVGDIFIFKMYRHLSNNEKEFTGPFVMIKISE